VNQITSQLTIRLGINEPCDFKNYHAGANAEIVGSLKELTLRDGFAGIWLWGEAGTGRSHLLQAVCREADVHSQSSVYLPLSLIDPDPMTLDGLSADIIVVDDIHNWLNDPALEAVLVGLYQGQMSTGGRLLISAPAPAGGLEFALPDLASRMRALASYRITKLDDEGLTLVLRRAARLKGLQLEQSVIDFWLARTTRALPKLLEQLNQLDDMALSTQRRITIPLLKDVLRL
jgi:DnaA family protein